MRNRFAIIIIAAAALASCGKETWSPRPKEEMVEVELAVSLPGGDVQGVAARTRVAVSEIMPDSTLPYFSVCTVPEVTANADWYNALGYDNIRAYAYWSSYSGTNPRNVYSASNSHYLPRGAANTMTRIGFFPTKGPITLYGVHPYMPDFHTMVSDLDRIPFEVGYRMGGTSSTTLQEAYIYDYMYMVDGDSAGGNYMNPIHFDMVGVEPGESRTMRAHFKHVMTCVELRMKTTLHGTVQVDSVALDAFDGAQQRASIFARSGTFSVRDGSITSSERFTSHLTMRYDLSPTGTTVLATLYYKYNTSYTPAYYTPFAFIFPAVEHRPGVVIRATVYIRRYSGNNGGATNNGQLDMEGQVCVMEFPLDNILTDPDGEGPLPASNRGLMQGFRYVYSAEVDNFIKYSGYPEIEEWSVPDPDNPNDPNRDQIKDIVI